MPEETMSVPGEEKRSRSWFNAKFCCGCAGAATAIAVVVAGILAYYGYRFWTTKILQDKPLEIAPVTFQPDEAEEIKSRIQQRIEKGDGRIALTDREVNILVLSGAAHRDDLAGFRVTFEGDMIQAQVSFLLDKENQRFLNLNCKGRALVDNGLLALEIQEGQLGAVDVVKAGGPAAVSAKLVEIINSNEEARSKLMEVKRFRIEGGRAIIELKK